MTGIERVIARFSVDQAAEMTLKSRQEIADWLRIQADNLVSDGWNYDTFFVSRYIATINTPEQKELDFGRERREA